MATTVTRDEVRRLQAEGALVLEALPRKEYEWKHIAGAINIPIKDLNERSVAQLDREQPVVTYCNDFQ